MRLPAPITVLVTGGAAVAFGALAIGAAMAVPDRPAAAHVEHYVEDLQTSPPPAESAKILSDATGASVPAASTTSVPEPDDADDSSGPGSGRDDSSGSADDSSGPGSGNDDVSSLDDDLEPDSRDSSGPGSGEDDDDSGSDRSDSSGPGSGDDD